MEQAGTLSPQQLEQAFQVFNLASSDLCTAYEELRAQATVLTRELALANGELQRQFEEKQALRESMQRTERLAAMGEMAARLAHQLRTPLATALLYAAQLADPELPAAKRAGFAGKTVDRLRHLERLIEDMLLFVRGVSADVESVAAADLLADAFQTLEPQALARGLLLQTRDESGGRKLKADRLALSSALLGLTENALLACRPGGRVCIAAVADDAGFEFRVSDEGAGIAPEVQERLFEPFFTTRKGGTGLGLAIVHAVAEAHGGSVNVRSNAGKGSEFLLHLPLDFMQGGVDDSVAIADR